MTILKSSRLLAVVFMIITTQLPAAPPTSQPTSQTTGKPHNFAQWENEIAGIEKREAANPPPKQARLFIGSSTVRFWKTLAQDFPDMPAINQGFGGSETVDSTHFADRLIFPFEPSQILLYAGGNDIHNGKSPEQVCNDYRDFYTTVHAKLPTVPIIFISVHPSPSRWGELEKDKQFNQLVKQFVADNPDHQYYIDAYDLSLDANGDARKELFRADMLHFNDEGYKLLAERVREQLPKVQ